MSILAIGTGSDVSSLDDSMVRRVIRKPFDIHAVADALIETARQMAQERRENDDVITPDVIMVDVNEPTAPPET